MRKACGASGDHDRVGNGCRAHLGAPFVELPACAKPWPCGPARESLISEMDRVALAVYMWSNLSEAIGDLPPGPTPELFERFIQWAHRS